MLLVGVFEMQDCDSQIIEFLVYLMIHCKQTSFPFCDNSFFLVWDVYDVLSALLLLFFFPLEWILGIAATLSISPVRVVQVSQEDIHHHKPLTSKFRQKNESGKREKNENKGPWRSSSQSQLTLGKKRWRKYRTLWSTEQHNKTQDLQILPLQEVESKQVGSR